MALNRIRRASLEDMAAFIDQREADVLEVLANEIPERQQFDALNSAIEELNCIRDQIATDGICRSTAMSLEAIRPDTIPRGFTVNSYTQHHSRVGLAATMEAVDGLTIGLVVAAVAAAVAIMVKLTRWVIKKWKSRKDDKYIGGADKLESLEHDGAKVAAGDSENKERLNKYWNKAVQQALEPNHRSVFYCLMQGFKRQHFRKAIDGISAKIDILEKSAGGWSSLFNRGRDNAEMAQASIDKATDNVAINELGRAMNWLGTGSSKDFDVTVAEIYKQFNEDIAVNEGAPNDDWSKNVTAANNVIKNSLKEKEGIMIDLEHLEKKLEALQKKLASTKDSKDEAKAEINRAVHEAANVLKRQMQAITTLCAMHMRYSGMMEGLTYARIGLLEG